MNSSRRIFSSFLLEKWTNSSEESEKRSARDTFQCHLQEQKFWFWEWWEVHFSKVFINFVAPVLFVLFCLWHDHRCPPPLPTSTCALFWRTHHSSPFKFWKMTFFPLSCYFDWSFPNINCPALRLSRMKRMLSLPQSRLLVSFTEWLCAPAWPGFGYKF